MNGRTADATPHAAALVESLRDIGYSVETALADILDNSITHGAANIRIFVDAVSDEPAVAIVDDGSGMSEAELIEAMRPGSRNPRDARSANDLGRFGLGLKSASFSQFRRLTVVTRKEGVTAAARWDLDEVSRTNSWSITLPTDVPSIRWSDVLGEKGTLVLWEKLDRLTAGITHDGAKRTEHMNAAFSAAERHLRLVFHRYMQQPKPLRLWLNGRGLNAIDPFASTHPATQADPEEPLQLSAGMVRFRCYTLPHHKAVSTAEWEEMGGAEGHLKSQGFYVYRERRLIIAGSWLGLARQTELTKLCRVQVDIPNTMDAAWKIDVKKASAQLPPPVRDRLKRIVERFQQTSKRTYRRRGQKLVDEKRTPMWSRILQDGRILYRPNIEHPAFADFEDRLPADLRHGFRNCVALLGAALPVAALHADMLGEPEAVVADVADADAIEQLLHAVVPRLLEQGVPEAAIRSTVREIDLIKSSWAVAEPMLEALLYQE